MSRLSFFFRVEPVPPEKFIHEYSGTKNSRILNEFKPRAERYRRRNFIAVSLMVGFIFGIMVLSKVHIPDSVALWICAFLVAGAFIASFILIFGLKLVCPVCRKRLEPAKGLYCPVCGSDKFQYGSHMRGESCSSYAYCPSCDGNIDEGGGDLPRSYNIRGCTHCGVMLDEKGL